MTSSKQTIELVFGCDQQWENMAPTACGRFCTMCSREVIDMTSKSPKEILRIVNENDAVCASLLPEQLEPDLVPVEFTLLKRLRYYAAAVAAFFGVEITQLGARHAHKEATVLVPPEGNFAIAEKDDPTGRDSRSKRRGKLVKKTKKSAPPDPVAVKSKRRKKVYFTKRFPFVVIQRKRIMGRIRSTAF